MLLTKSVKNAAIHKKIFEFKPGRFTRVLTGVATHWQCYQDQPNQPLGGYLLQLAKKDFVCLDYIILHELLHLEVKDHSERFISLLDKYMPFWRETKNKLNSQILDFME